MQERNFELLKKSDPAALEKIHAQYSRRIFWLGRKIIDDEFIVENLVQDTFLKLWDYRDKIEDPSSYPFFLAICYENILLCALFKTKKQVF